MPPAQPVVSAVLVPITAGNPTTASQEAQGSEELAQLKQTGLPVPWRLPLTMASADGHWFAL